MYIGIWNHVSVTDSPTFVFSDCIGVLGDQYMQTWFRIYLYFTNHNFTVDCYVLLFRVLTVCSFLLLQVKLWHLVQKVYLILVIE